MGTYATAAQLASECKITAFSASTNPSTTKADEIIAEVEAFVDSRLATKYTLPLADSRSTLLVRGIVLALAAPRVREIIEVRTQSSNVEQSFQRSIVKDALNRLDQIVSGEIKLDEEIAASRDGVRSYAYENGYCPVFKVGEDNW